MEDFLNFTSDSWSISQEYSNNTITQKWLVIAQYTEQVLIDKHRQQRQMPNTETTHHL